MYILGEDEMVQKFINQITNLKSIRKVFMKKRDVKVTTIPGIKSLNIV